MKNIHRKTHLIAWLLMTPLLCIILFVAINARVDNKPVTESSAMAEQGGLLP